MFNVVIFNHPLYNDHVTLNKCAGLVNAYNADRGTFTKYFITLYYKTDNKYYKKLDLETEIKSREQSIEWKEEQLSELYDLKTDKNKYEDDDYYPDEYDEICEKILELESEEFDYNIELKCEREGLEILKEKLKKINLLEELVKKVKKNN